MITKEFLEKKYTPLEIAGILELAEKDPDALVLRSEQYYHHQVDSAMLLVKKNMPNYKFVLLCGPSASGKTTTAHALASLHGRGRWALRTHPTISWCETAGPCCLRRG